MHITTNTENSTGINIVGYTNRFGEPNPANKVAYIVLSDRRIIFGPFHDGTDNFRLAADLAWCQIAEAIMRDQPSDTKGEDYTFFTAQSSSGFVNVTRADEKRTLVRLNFNWSTSVRPYRVQPHFLSQPGAELEEAFCCFDPEAIPA